MRAICAASKASSCGTCRRRRGAGDFSACGVCSGKTSASPSGRAGMKLPALKARGREAAVSATASQNRTTLGQARRLPRTLSQLEGAPRPPLASNQTKETMLNCEKLQQEAQHAGEELLRKWVAKAKDTLGKLLELNRKVDTKDVQSGDWQTQLVLARAVEMLRRELEASTLHSAAVDGAVRKKCRVMLNKIAAILVASRQGLHAIETDRLAAKQFLSNQLRIPDAEFCVTGYDGKQLFFKQRQDAKLSDGKTIDEGNATRVTAMVVPHPIGFAADDSIDIEVFSAVPKQVRLGRGMIAREWAKSVVVGVCQIDGRRVFARVREYVEKNALEAILYCADRCQTSYGFFPIGFLPLLRADSPLWWRSLTETDLSWWHGEEARNCAITIMSCFRWEPKGRDALILQLPTQHRQARTFCYRTYATFHGLLSIRLEQEFSLTIHFLDARTMASRNLCLIKSVLVPIVGGDFESQLLNPVSRGNCYRLVCKRLYFEYTTRGFELLFPGLKPKGRLLPHPTEVAMRRDHAERLSGERETLSSAMATCARQAAGRAIRRAEQYSLRWKQRQHEAAERIQQRTRALFRHRQARHSAKLRSLAAVIIQKHVRRMRAMKRLQRRQLQYEHDRTGTFFRHACRINRSFVLVNIHLVVNSGSASNTKDRCGVESLHVEACHPVSSHTAATSINCDDLCLAAHPKELRKISTRRQLVDLLVQHHLDVFRSAQHNVLVIALK